MLTPCPLGQEPRACLFTGQTFSQRVQVLDEIRQFFLQQMAILNLAPASTPTLLQEGGLLSGQVAFLPQCGSRQDRSLS